MRWALVAHTAALFLFLTIPLAIAFDYLSTEYVNNREFPGDDEFPPGPMGYDALLALKATTTVFYAMFPLNQWLADGLLLYRCYVIYSMNRWAMAFPSLMYLASVVLGIASIYYNSGVRYYTDTETNIATSYYSICLSLSILLTLMIVIRLIVHIRSVRNVTGASEGSGGLQTATATIVMMFIESYALYAGVLLAYTIPWALNSWVDILFSGVLNAVQVISPYLIILRVAKRRAMTSEWISGTTESICFRSQGATDDDRSISEGDTVNATELNDETAGQRVAVDGNPVEEVPL